jgi:hypothetical protein
MNKPWYKQFWPWFLMSLPFSVVIAMIITLSIASQYGNPMVVDDYYKKGRGINAEVAKVEAAQKLDISFNFQQREQNFELNYRSGTPRQLTALKVAFYHSTQAERDFTLTLSADANGVFRGQLPENAAGKWTITITPFDNSWRLSQQIVLPSSLIKHLQPLTYGV